MGSSAHRTNLKEFVLLRPLVKLSVVLASGLPVLTLLLTLNSSSNLTTQPQKNVAPPVLVLNLRVWSRRSRSWHSMAGALATFCSIKSAPRNGRATERVFLVSLGR